MRYTDPAGMPEDERMTGAELKVVREHLGLTTRWLADHLGVAERSVHRWEMEATPIPDGVRLEVERLEQVTAAAVMKVVDGLMDLPDPGLYTYRTDADYRAHHPEVDWPASWHRALIGRVADDVPGLAIAYYESADVDPGTDEGAPSRRRGERGHA